MNLHFIALIAAALCATLVDAATIQPVEAGLHPIFGRIASVEVEILMLGKAHRNSAALNEDRLLAEEKIKSLQSEKRRLEAEILWAKDVAQSPLVTFFASSNEDAL
jgi:hypothetical protein